MKLPILEPGIPESLTVRDIFAWFALSGLAIPIGSPEPEAHRFSWTDVAWTAYQVADAMLAERAKSAPEAEL